MAQPAIRLVQLAMLSIVAPVKIHSFGTLLGWDLGQGESDLDLGLTIIIKFYTLYFISFEK